MNNPERILAELDRRLNGQIELNLIGRAAIAMGYFGDTEEFEKTKDVDTILAIGDTEAMLARTNFWQVQKQINEALKTDELYLTHTFEEYQIIIQPDWKINRQAIPTRFKNIQLFRPATIDLILTKMMRDDLQDIKDIEFLINHDKITREQLETAIQNARVPAIQEIHDEFNKMRPKVLQLGLNPPGNGRIR